MKDRVFIDTNVFVYTQSSVEPEKRSISTRILHDFDCYTSTQVLNEFCNVMTKKVKMTVAEVKQVIKAINNCCTIVIVDCDTVNEALGIKEKYGYTYYDSLILASALESGCQRIFTEDMQDGQIIDGVLRIENVFGVR